MSTPSLRLRSRLRLMVLTDASLAGPRGIEFVVMEALRGGATCIQLREKHQGAGEVLPLAQRIRGYTREAGALFIVNDRLDLAIAAEADGVHLGPDDLPIEAVRRLAPPDFILGYSTDVPERARSAEREGADYLGCGTVWPTASKSNAGEAIGLDGVQRVVDAVSLPVVAIGGISLARAPLLRETGVAGLAVLSEVMAAPDPSAAAAALLAAAP
jgi:thiamine-phosphate pyrophosphorylase